MEAESAAGDGDEVVDEVAYLDAGGVEDIILEHVPEDCVVDVLERPRHPLPPLAQEAVHASRGWEEEHGRRHEDWHRQQAVPERGEPRPARVVRDRARAAGALVHLGDCYQDGDCL